MAKTPRVRDILSFSGAAHEVSGGGFGSSTDFFNSPLITFQSEIFIVLMISRGRIFFMPTIARKGIEYRYYRACPKRGCSIDEVRSCQALGTGADV